MLEFYRFCLAQVSYSIVALESLKIYKYITLHMQYWPNYLSFGRNESKRKQTKIERVMLENLA